MSNLNHELRRQLITFDNTDKSTDEGALKAFEQIEAYINQNYTKRRKTISHEEAMDFVEREILSKQYQPKTVRISRTELMNDPVYCLTEVRVDNERENK